MFPSMDPRQMQALLKKMGIKSKPISAKRVVIELDGESLIVKNPNIIEIEVRGKKSYQIEGEVETEISVSEEDIKLVMEKTGCSREKAYNVLKEKKDLAEAILYLKQGD